MTKITLCEKCKYSHPEYCVVDDFDYTVYICRKTYDETIGKLQCNDFKARDSL